MSTLPELIYYSWTKLGDIYVDINKTKTNGDFLKTFNLFDLLNKKVLNITNETSKGTANNVEVNVEYYTEPNELSHTHPLHVTELPDKISFKIMYKHSGTTTIKRFVAYKKNKDTNITDFSKHYYFPYMQYNIIKNLTENGPFIETTEEPLNDALIEPTMKPFDASIYKMKTLANNPHAEKTPDEQTHAEKTLDEKKPVDQTKDDNITLHDVINKTDLDKYIGIILNTVSKNEINELQQSYIDDYDPPKMPNIQSDNRYYELERKDRIKNDEKLKKWETDVNTYNLNYIDKYGLRIFAIKNYYYKINEMLIRPGIRVFPEQKSSTEYDNYKPSQIIGGKNLKVKNNEPKYKEILGKRMKIYKMPDSRKEYVKYKKELISISDYKKLVKLKAKPVTKPKSAPKSATKPKTKSATKPKTKSKAK